MTNRTSQTASRAASKHLHPRNLHNSGYDFKLLCEKVPDLADYIYQTPRGDDSIKFSDPYAVKLLNSALLHVYYGVRFWDLPEGALCPAIPGRVDYIHYLADLLKEDNQGKVPEGKRVVGLDVGTGASCIYPIVGTQSYGWKFVASDINPVSVAAAKNVVALNSSLKGKIRCQLQPEASAYFTNIIKPGEQFTFTLCNPPFHSSLKEALSGSQRKVKNLNRSAGRKAPDKMQLNFAGQGAELWCEGGEKAFLCGMIKESVSYAEQCLWFTSLVSKKETLPALYQVLKRARVKQVKTIEMLQGNKTTRFIAWTFLNTKQRRDWFCR